MEHCKSMEMPKRYWQIHISYFIFMGQEILKENMVKLIKQNPSENSKSQSPLKSMSVFLPIFNQLWDMSNLL